MSQTYVSVGGVHFADSWVQEREREGGHKDSHVTKLSNLTK
jgi:hypothetical protein